MSIAPAVARSLPMVYLVDDEEVVRDALGWLLRTRRLVSEGFDSGEAFDAFVRARRDAHGDDWLSAPSCVLLDMRVSGMSGLALFERLIDYGLTEQLPVIFLTGHGDVPTAVAAVKRGAFDFVEKPFSDNALVDRIEEALAASGRALDRVRERRVVAAALAELTEREREVMRLIALGRPNKLIADELEISVRTVEVHRSHVFEKMNVRSAVELANLLNQRGE